MKSLETLSDNGVGIYFLKNYQSVKELRTLLEESSFFINSSIQLPIDFYRPVTSLRGVLIFISITFLANRNTKIKIVKNKNKKLWHSLLK